MSDDYWRDLETIPTAEGQGYDAGFRRVCNASYQGRAWGRTLDAALEAFERGFLRGLADREVLARGLGLNE